MKMMNLIFAFAAFQLFTTASLAQQGQELMVEPSYEAPTGELFDEASYLAGTSILNQFTNVIVVNKAAKGSTAQTIRMFTDGKEVQLPFNKVSTGLENVEVVKGFKKIFRHLGAKGTTTSHWRHTTKGFYSVKRVENMDYKSGESSFHMPYAVFFNSTNGLALHEVPWEFSQAGHEALGRRASSGCVRVHKNTIPGINQAVRDAGKGLVPVIDPKTGLQVVKDGVAQTQTGWKSIVIIQEVKD